MIPKVIHYCWFGKKKKSKLAEKCIDSWKKYCPDYEIIEWNEDNFDVSLNPYTQYCHDNNKWAFLSDFVRLMVTSKYGGLYFDTDVELINKPDHLLSYEAFYGFETSDYVNTGLGFGTEANHPVIIAMLNQYMTLIETSQSEFPSIKCPELNTKALLEFGLKKSGEWQKLEGAIILPIDYLNPYDDSTGRLKITNNTVSIHWYGKSWIDKKTVLRSKITKPFHRLFGVDCFSRFKR